MVPLAGGALSSLGVTDNLTVNPALVLDGWALFTSSYRIGRRRIKQINADPSLDGVTAQAIVSALVAAGAVDGNTVLLKYLRKLVRYEEGLEEDLRELEKVGVRCMREAADNGGTH